MNDDTRDDKNSDEVVLRMKVNDVLDYAVKSSNRPMLSERTAHDIEGEDIKKAWFRHMLSSMERLGTLVENLRTTEMSGLKADVKDEIRRVEARLDRLEQQVQESRKELLAKVDKLDTELTEKIDRYYRELLEKIAAIDKDLQAYKLIVDGKFVAADKDFQDYKSKVIIPLKAKVDAIGLKIGFYGSIAGVVGTGIAALGFYLLKIYVFKTPGP